MRKALKAAMLVTEVKKRDVGFTYQNSIRLYLVEMLSM